MKPSKVLLKLIYELKKLAESECMGRVAVEFEIQNNGSVKLSFRDM